MSTHEAAIKKSVLISTSAAAKEGTIFTIACLISRFVIRVKRFLELIQA